MSHIIQRGLTALLLWAVTTVSTVSLADEFPGRSIYVNLTPISTQELKQRLNEFTIIDVRSRFEYDTLHISKALHIPLFASDFTQQVAGLQQQNDSPIAFYCNGRTCFKSYKAAEAAEKAGLKNIHVYDAGIFEWAQTYPEEATLLNENAVDPSRLIGKEQLQAHMLSPNEFEKRVTDNDAVVIDIRDPLQRDGLGLFIGREQNIPLDKREKLKKVFLDARRDNQTVLIYDMAGKQVRWLQYDLEHLGVKRYYFMQGGAKALFAEMM